MFFSRALEDFSRVSQVMTFSGDLSDFHVMVSNSPGSAKVKQENCAPSETLQVDGDWVKCNTFWEFEVIKVLAADLNAQDETDASGVLVNQVETRVVCRVNFADFQCTPDTSIDCSIPANVGGICKDSGDVIKASTSFAAGDLIAIKVTPSHPLPTREREARWTATYGGP
jgi:hypothetical protein